VPYKGADMLLEAALPFLRANQLALHILGDGPERGTLEAMVDNLGVRQNVSFYGWIPHTEVQKTLRDCDLMALPSIREFGGGVVVEAMALGVTPMVADYGGPAELVDEHTGIRIPFQSKQSLIDGFRHALADVIKYPEKLDHLGAAGYYQAQKK